MLEALQLEFLQNAILAQRRFSITLRDQPDNLLPINHPISTTEFFSKPECEPVDDLCIGFFKILIALFRLMTKRFDDLGVQCIVAGDEAPEILST